MKAVNSIIFALTILTISAPAFAKREWKTYDCQNTMTLQEFGFAEVGLPSGRTTYYIAWDGKQFNLQVDAAVTKNSDGTIDVIAGNVAKDVQAEGTCARAGK